MNRYWICALLITVLWAAAFGFPALGTCRPDGAIDYFDNINIFLGSPFGFIFNEFGWYANVFLAIAVISLLKENNASLRIAIIGFALACTTFIPVDMSHNEGGREYPLCSWSIGFWLWFSTHIIVLVIAKFPYLLEDKRK